MRRAYTRAWNTLSTLSLLLGAATVVLWVRSYSVEDIREMEQIWPLPDDPKDDGFVAYTSHLVSDRGYVQFESLVTIVRGWPHSAFAPPPYEARWRHSPPYGHITTIDEPARTSRRFWLAAQTAFGGAKVKMMNHRRIAVAYWWFVLAFWLLPVWRLLGGFRNRLRRTRGLCLSCGYDLRATPEL